MKRKSHYSVMQNTVFIIKSLWGFSRNEMLLLSLQVPAQVIAPFLAILLPKTVIERVTRQSPPGELAMMILLYTLAMTTCLVLSRFVEGKKSNIAIKMRMRFTVQQFWKALDMDYENVEDPEVQATCRRASDFLTRSNSGGEACVRALVALLVNILGMILYGSLILTLNPVIAIGLIIMALACFAAARGQQNYEYSRKAEKTLNEMRLQYAYERGCAKYAGKDIRIYDIGSLFSYRHDLYLGALMVINRQIELRAFLVAFLSSITAFLRDGLAYGYLIYLVSKGRMTVADLTLFVGAIAGFSAWLDGIFEQLRIMNQVSLECCDFRSYMETPDRMNRAQGAPLPDCSAAPPDINMQDVAYRYPGAQSDTIKNINIHIKSGERVALVGRNGAGKTTLVKVLTGLYAPTRGQVLLCGTSSSEFNRDEYYDMFSSVFQRYAFLPVSIAENVAYSDKPDPGRLEYALRAAGMYERVSQLPNGADSLMLKDIYDEAVDFSGGEDQRLILARALYKDAPVIVLDEPTAALDPIAESRLYEKFAGLTEGKTSLYISHRLASTRFCDRVLFMDGGEIIEEGTHDELMTLGGKYAEMFEIQSQYYNN